MNAISKIAELKALPKEQVEESLISVWEKLQNAKSGYIKLTKLTDNPGYLGQNDVVRGFTPAFGEGLACYVDRIDEYYYTSIIQSIDWDNKTFKTLNSIYKFEFDESTN